MPPVLPDLPALLVRQARQAQRVRRVPRAPPGLLVLPDPLAQRVPPDLPALPGQPVLLLRQYMHNTEIAVTMRLSTILKTIKQPL